MNLYCCEVSGDDENTAYDDPTLLHDRVLENLLRTEDRYVVSSCTPFGSVQKEVTLEMRKIVAEWMMEVCEEQKCHDAVFSLAMNCMDRFLMCCSISKNQLQLLGTTCMLISSKLRESRPLASETLIYYTDHSIKKHQLTSWELLVLSKLKWDIAAVTPQDFLKHLLKKLSALESHGISLAMVNKHARTLITLCLQEFTFARYHPSIIASASIAASLCGLNWEAKSGRSMEDLLRNLAAITHVDKEFVQQCYQQIDEMIRQSTTVEIDSTKTPECDLGLRPDEFTPPPLKTQHEAALTPTDVHDIHF